MRLVIQRVSKASVTIDNLVHSAIGMGFLVLVGIEETDDESDADWLAGKLINMRIFSDSDGKMNLSVRDVSGGLLLVPQFTLAADTTKGMCPSFTPAADPETGRRLFDHLVNQAHQAYPSVSTGIFGADMQVVLTNDGPVTFWLTA